MKKILIVLIAVCLITASVPCICVGAESVNLFYEDFEDYGVGDFLPQLTQKQVTKWSVSNIAEGDKLEIIEISGNKKLKLTRAESNVADTAAQKTTVYMMFDRETDTGSIDLSYEITMVNCRGGLSSLFTVRDAKKSTTVNHSFLNRSLIYNHRSDSKGCSANLQDYFNVPVNVSKSINLETGYYTFLAKSGDTVIREVGPNQKQAGTGSAGSMEITAYYQSTGSAPSAPTDGSGDGVYVFDNISVSKKYLNVVSDLESEINADDVAAVKFNASLDGSSLQNKVFLYEKNDAVSSEEYSVSVDSTDSCILNISKNGGFDYGKSYKLILKKGIKSASGQYDALDSDCEIKFTVVSILPQLSITENEKYNGSVTVTATEKSDYSYEYSLKYNDGEKQTYSPGTKITEIGSYTLYINVTNPTNNKSQQGTVNFSVVGKTAPEARDVKISGTAEIGSVLTGEYTFYDVNSDSQGNSLFEWLVCETKDGEYSPIEGANSDTYTVDEKMLDKYIKFRVTPVSLQEPYTGESVESDYIAGPFLPVAKNVSISGKCEMGAELSGLYTYYDENGEDVSGSYKWYKSSEKDKDYELINGAESEKYTLSATDIDMYIYFEVTPKNSLTGKTIKSQAFLLPSRPEAKSAEILGMVKVGQSVGGGYTFSDKNGDPEGNSIYSWKINGIEVSTGATYTIGESDVGKTLTFSVTPVSEKEPKRGETITTAGYTVSFPGSGSNFGSGSSGVTVTQPKDTEKENVKDIIPENKPETEQKETFSDIENHWAKKQIEELYEKKIVTGFSDNKFKPDDSITRAEISTLTVRAFNLENASETVFGDVSENEWYSEYISKISAAGYMNGFEGLFRPKDYISREEISVLINNILKDYSVASDIGVDPRSFSDYDKISGWAKEAVENVCNAGIMNGRTAETFSPDGYMTRAEFAVVLSRLSDIIEGGKQ